MKTALIIGAGGQDGAYLAKFLLDKNYNVICSARGLSSQYFLNLIKLNIFNNVTRISIAINDFRSVLTAIEKFSPDEIYNLAGQSSVSLSYEQPVEAIESIVIGTLNILESIRFSKLNTKFYNAGSGDCFGNTDNLIIDEQSRFKPTSPYAVAKACAYDLVNNYREAYNIFACTGILFNHESPLRPDHFVTKKITNSAAQIYLNQIDRLKIGNLNISRDWGWAPDYVEAMWMMVNLDKAENFIISTGITTTLKEFLNKSFNHFGLNWENFVDLDASLLRPTDIQSNGATPLKAKHILDWSPKHYYYDVVNLMCESSFIYFKDKP